MIVANPMIAARPTIKVATITPIMVMLMILSRRALRCV